jgi:hypothetical protein
MKNQNDSELYRSEFQFELVGPDAKFTDDQFDRINREVLIWSLNEAVPCEVERTLAGFSVVSHHSLDVGMAYGRRLHKHLINGIFRELNSKEISFTYLGR